MSKDVRSVVIDSELWDMTKECAKGFDMTTSAFVRSVLRGAVGEKEFEVPYHFNKRITK